MIQKLYHTLRGTILILPFLTHLLIADLLLSLLLPISFLLPDLTYHASSAIAGSVWQHIQTIFERLNSAPITSSGATLIPGESAIVVANHNAWADFYLIQHVAIEASMLRYCRWFAKAQLKSVPLLGWGLWAMGMPLVTRNWTNDSAEMARVFAGPRDRRWPMWLVSFSEATRFTPSKYAEAIQWCRRQGKPEMHWVLYPRTKGFVASVQALKGRAEQVKAVLDFTIAYAEKRDDGRWEFMSAPDIWTTLSAPGLGERFRFWVNVRRFEMADLPAGTEREQLATWLEKRWVEKSEMLERLFVRIKAGEDVAKLKLE